LDADCAAIIQWILRCKGQKNIKNIIGDNCMKGKILIILLVLLLASCIKPENLELQNLTLKEINPLQDPFDIAKSNKDVRELLQGKSYNVEVKEVDENDKKSLPNVYNGLEGRLYKVHFKSIGYELIVITDETNVVAIVPVTKITI
jgi:hypothetical protein